MLSRLTFPIEYLHPSSLQWHRVINPFKDFKIFKQIKHSPNALIKWYQFIGIDFCWVTTCPGSRRASAQKLWHNVWQILQEIPSGLFKFLWTATILLSHIIVAEMEWVWYTCELSAAMQAHTLPRTTLAMTELSSLIDNYDVGLSPGAHSPPC